MLAKLARVLGIRRRVVVDGVRYTERGPSRRGALGRGASGRGAEWEVRFPSGEAMLIHPGVGRVFHDLDPTAALPPHRLLADRVRPGRRVLDAWCGTGAGAGALLRMAGPSGAVVALGGDEESVEYARRRYPAENAAFELGGLEALEGEVEGAFDAVVAARGLLSGSDDAARAGELWRLVAPGGTLLVECPAGAAGVTATVDLIASVTGERPERIDGTGGEHACVLVTRPEGIDIGPGPDEDEEAEPPDDEWRFTG